MTNAVPVDALAWALIHFLWQGATIALASAAAASALGPARPRVRYGIHASALGLMAVAPVATILWRLTSAAGPVALPARSAVSAGPSVAAPAGAASSGIDWLAVLVFVWLAGVTALGVRAAGGFVVAQRLKRRSAVPAPPLLRRAAARIARKLGLDRRVRVLVSRATDVPLAIGWLRPVVLLPASALTALPPDQITLILAHELAHIRRHDYLVNLMQIAVETVLFYHPAVWWLSGRLRLERELCCDDLAVQVTGEAAPYARALAALESLLASPPRVGMAANGAPLLARIERLAGKRPGPSGSAPAWAAGALVATIVVATALGTSWPDAAAADRPASAPTPASGASSDGLLAALSAAGYGGVSVDEIIALKDHGVSPVFIKTMAGAGLGRLDPGELIQLYEHGVTSDFVRRVVDSALVADLDVDNAIRMREHGVDPKELARIRALGFGPYETSGVVRMSDHGAGSPAFEVLREIGMTKAGVADAIEIHENGITLARVKDLERQGFKGLTLEQILKLARGGVI